MRWFRLIAIAMLVWGDLAFANLPPDAVDNSRQELQTITSWMAHLNFYYPNVDVSATLDLNSKASRLETLRELRELEEFLRHEVELPLGSLQNLCCVRPVCGG